MQSRLAHKVEEKILNLAAQTVGEEIKFIRAHKLFCPFRLVTEGARKIADIRDLEVGFVYHQYLSRSAVLA